MQRLGGGLIALMPVEQQELGDLEGAPGWAEVLDMACGKVYFWQRDTGQVAWDPPPHSTPRSAFLKQTACISLQAKCLEIEGLAANRQK